MILTDGRRQQHTIEGARANVSGVGGELVRPGPTFSDSATWRRRQQWLEAARRRRERRASSITAYRQTAGTPTVGT